MTTTTTTDEGNAPSENQDDAPKVTIIDDSDYVPDIDPMLEEAKAAEAEIAAAGKSEGSAPDAKAPEAKAEGQPAPEAPAQGKTASPMIPKARLDEVLSERDLLRDQVGYLRGVVDAQKAHVGQKPTEAKATTEPVPAPDQGQGGVDEINAAIAAAEEKKLALAERYDNGDISTKQMKEQEIAIDRELRALSDKRIEKIREESRGEVQNVLAAHQQKNWIETQALSIQNAHPNVAVIDATPEHIRKGIWDQITAEAAQNLSQRGIDPRANNPQVRIALMQEKARLTDRYTPETLQAFLPAGYAAPAKPANQTQGPANTQAQKQPSETALNRIAKMELANSQPPSIAEMGTGGGTADLTEADIERMTEDQVADLLKTAPALVQRVLAKR